MPIQPIYLKIGPNWQCCLAGSSKTAPRILIFSIAMGAEYLSYVKFIATESPTFFGYIISVLASVHYRVNNYHCRTFQPWTFQAKDSTTDFSTPDFSTIKNEIFGHFLRLKSSGFKIGVAKSRVKN
jgi:hypothetical protein